MKDFPDLPPVWFAFSALMVWVMGKFAPVASIAGPVASALAVILAVAAVALGLWSAFGFYRHKTTIEPRHRPSELIETGAYRISRNPIYLAMVMLTFAFALWLGPLPGFLPVIFLWAVLRQRFILGEEETLRQVFGDEAESYLLRTRRWL